ncbi:hypothetical protein F5B20DRAFT_566292 [Whalleya microplaca]|nr:hypothetical protein F5B20DRAFT_566292 [Whalleya microplaca]
MASLHDISIATLTKILGAEAELLKKAETFAKEKGQPISDFLTARIHEDMFPLTIQISITAMTARKAAGRLTGTELPEVADLTKERTLEECQSLIAETVALLAAIKPESINGTESEVVPCNVGKHQAQVAKSEYIRGYSIPNSFFHLTTTYDILRMKGVPLGKMDYLDLFVKGWF